jgi:hypothetical protein
MGVFVIILGLLSKYTYAVTFFIGLIVILIGSVSQNGLLAGTVAITGLILLTISTIISFTLPGFNTINGKENERNKQKAKESSNN